jgi:hypothetical protein
LLRYWNDAVEDMEEVNLSNKKGRSRTIHENKLIMGLLLMLTKTYLSFCKQGGMNASEVNWSMLYSEIAINLHVKRRHVVELHHQMIENGDILVFGQGEGSKRGPK